MIVYHFLYDVRAFSKFPLALPEWFWPFGTHVIGFLFFTLFGISAWLAYNSDSANYPSRSRRRGVILVTLSLVISAISVLFNPSLTIYFGVLHCFAACAFLTYPFLKTRKYNLVIGLLIVAGAFVLQQFRFPFSSLMWLGLRPEIGTGGDWFPLIPWFGIALIGIRFGEFLYPRPDSPSRLHGLKWGQGPRGLVFLGRHSLPIYVLHQPLLLAAVHLATRFHFL